MIIPARYHKKREASLADAKRFAILASSTIPESVDKIASSHWLSMHVDVLVFWDDEAEGDDKDFGNYDGLRKKANRYGWTLREIPKSDVVKLVGVENFTTENIVPIALSSYWALSERKGAGYCTFDNTL